MHPVELRIMSSPGRAAEEKRARSSRAIETLGQILPQTRVVVVCCCRVFRLLLGAQVINTLLGRQCISMNGSV